MYDVFGKTESVFFLVISYFPQWKGCENLKIMVEVSLFLSHCVNSKLVVSCPQFEKKWGHFALAMPIHPSIHRAQLVIRIFHKL